MTDRGEAAVTGDVDALVQAVLRESYQQATEDLRAYAEKVRDFNRRKQAVREYLRALREFKSGVIAEARERGVNPGRGDEGDRAALAEVMEGQARPYDVGDIEYVLGIPNRVPPPAVNSLSRLENEIKKWEEKLNGIGDDAQLANVDLQNVLQKRQQTLQMLSNISKMLHDTAMCVIRKLGD